MLREKSSRKIEKKHSSGSASQPVKAVDAKFLSMFDFLKDVVIPRKRLKKRNGKQIESCLGSVVSAESKSGKSAKSVSLCQCFTQEISLDEDWEVLVSDFIEVPETDFNNKAGTGFEVQHDLLNLSAELIPESSVT